MSDKYFVWQQGLSRPYSAIWYDILVDGNSKPKETLFCIKLMGNEVSMSINELEQIYPLKIAGENAKLGISETNQDNNTKRN